MAEGTVTAPAGVSCGRPQQWVGLSWKDILAALALSNIVYLRVWAELFVSRDQYYWMETGPSPASFIALMLNVLLLALVVSVFILALRRRRGLTYRAAPLAGLMLMVTLTNSLRTLLQNPGDSLFLRFVQQRLLALAVITVITLVCALALGGMRVLRPVRIALMLLSPFAAITFGHAFMRIYEGDPKIAGNGPMAPRLPAKPVGAPRVIWVIFDEWDADLTFEHRPQGIALPEIERLRDRDFQATNVVTTDYLTDWSMPSLTTGIQIQKAEPLSPSDLSIWPKGSTQPVLWSRQLNVFGRARELGLNTAVVGWAVPYCRVLSASLSDCWWWPGVQDSWLPLPQIALNQQRSLWETTYRSPFGQSLGTQLHARTYQEELARALTVASDPGYGLALLHLAVPHAPYFYNAATGRYDHGAQPIFGLLKQNQQGYADALKLVDITIGKLREAMSRNGVWNVTTVIFSADHPYRHRPAFDGQPIALKVPFLLKAAGENHPARYTKSFSALLTHKLILAFLSGEVSRSEQIPAWLDAHISDYPAVPVSYMGLRQTDHE